MARTMNRDQFRRWQHLNDHVQRFYRDGGVATPTPEEWAEYEDLRKLVLPPQFPPIGTPCTYSIGSDRYRGTVDAVFVGGREIWAKVHRLGGMQFTYRPTDGSYREKGKPCGRLSLGVAEDYYDRGF